MTRTKPFSRILYYLLTALLAVAFVAPVLWAVYASIAPHAGTSQLVGYGVGNYGKLATYGYGLGRYLWNSVIVSGVTVIMTLFLSATAGYAFARYEFPAKRSMFVITLSVMMVPYAALLIPLLVWFRMIGLGNSLVGVGLVLTLFQLPFGVFLMRNSFASVPREIEEAALIDGCNAWTGFLRVMLPSARPGLVTVGLFAFLNAWNDFMVSLYLVGMEKAPLPLALVNMRQQTMGVIDYGSTTAGVVVLTIPALILFLVLQRYYVKGFTAGAVKG